MIGNGQTSHTSRTMRHVPEGSVAKLRPPGTMGQGRPTLLSGSYRKALIQKFISSTAACRKSTSA